MGVQEKKKVISGELALFYIRRIMKNLNLLIILWISGIICLTTYKIVGAGEAQAFIEQTEKIPIEPWKVPLIALAAYFILLTIMSLRCFHLEKEKNFILYGTVEVLLCMVIMGALNFNYNSIILLAIADLFIYWKNTKLRITAFIFLFILYIITDAAVYQNFEQMIPLSTYLTYYNAEAKTILISVKSILCSCNILLFMFYMILLIRVQRIENERILDLNRQLDEANEQLKIYAINTEKMAETRERNRLAREIHDTLGHVLTGIVAGIDACKKLIDYSTEETKEQLD
ncbi:MAG TPA: histidine kinase, partial [Lachnospiraceae bacterium]|nr:histidine kinase [Lachnospiraceae bacterium]